MKIVVVIAIILVLIAFGFFTKRDIGYLAVFSALLCGLLLTDMSIAQIFSLLPLSTIFSIILITIFFGYAVENGTAETLINKILTSMSARMMWFPLAMFLFSIVIAGAGLGASNSTMLLAPIAFLVGIKAKVSPLLLGVAVSCGTTIGSNFPFSYGGVIFASLVETQGYQGHLSLLSVRVALFSAAIFTLSFLLLFFTNKKAQHNVSVDASVCTTLTPVQKKTLILVAGLVVAIVIPSISAALFPHPFLTALARIFDLRVVMAAGIVLASLLKLADDKAVLQKRVPWNLIALISGMSMLIGIGKELGVTTMLANILTTRFSGNGVVYAIAVFAMLMSLFASATSIVLPTLLPMVTAVASITGLDAGYLYIALFMGASCGGISPFSNGGMTILGNSGLQGKARNTLFYQLLCMPFLEVIMCCFVLFLGSPLA